MSTEKRFTASNMTQPITLHCLWKGYGAEEASWTAVDDLGHAQELVQEYELRQAAERGEDVVGLQYVMVVSVDAEKVLDVSAVSV